MQAGNVERLVRMFGSVQQDASHWGQHATGGNLVTMGVLGNQGLDGSADASMATDAYSGLRLLTLRLTSPPGLQRWHCGCLLATEASVSYILIGLARSARICKPLGKCPKAVNQESFRLMP